MGRQREHFGEICEKKHSIHDKTIHEGLEYVLLFPDGIEVVKLPSVFRKRIQRRHWENYNSATLFIATRSDFLFSELPNFDDDSDFDQDKRLSDSDLDYSIYETRHTDSRGRWKMGASSSSEVEVEVPDTRSGVDPIKVHGENTPQTCHRFNDGCGERALKNRVSNLSATISVHGNCRSHGHML